MSSYVIGSFNLCKMSYRRDDKIKKSFKDISKIINDESFDVVALQEVFNEKVITNYLLPALDPQEWDYVWRSPTLYSSMSNEGYAYIWRKRRLKLVEANSNPEIYDKYSIKKNVGKGGILRPPLVARFTPQGLLGGSNFELRLINTHIAFGKPSGVVSDLSNGQIRKMELRALSEKVYRRVSTKVYESSFPSYTILMGDYNLCLAGDGSEILSALIPDNDKSDKINDIIPIDDKRNLLTVQREKTSLKRPKNSDKESEDGEESEQEIIGSEDVGDYYSKNYDHFSYESTMERDRGVRLIVSRVDALKDYYDNDLEKYRREVSDHVPIKLIVNLKTK